ncbi:unnamed protein product [Paramecium octaurelia]|uniref:Tetratricopeptide repeat protein n=1 Tax=Paramecium octaurelia TaxID=43137 RepID=A0A8S1W8K8_PAROT|nr:unnamed protein product [Paramecium octaurelia]
MQSLGWTKHQLLIQNMLFPQVIEVIVQGCWINMRMQSLGSTKHQLLIQNMLFPYVIKVDLIFLILIGGCLRMLDKYEDAITWFDKALAIDPKDVDSLYNKGGCLWMLNKYKDAITWSDKHQLLIQNMLIPQVIKVDFIILTQIGDCLRLLKQFDKSEKILHQAIQLNPNHTVSLDSLGICLQDQQKYQEALIYYERSLKIQSNNQWTKNQKEFCEQKLKQ